MSKVQATLTNVFKQSIGPPSPTPPADWPKYYNVSGAGSASWNGQYGQNGSQKGAPIYTKEGTAQSLYRLGAWRLGISGKQLMYVAGGAGASDGLPPLTGWAVATGHLHNGTAPAPALAAGPVAAGLD